VRWWINNESNVIVSSWRRTRRRVNGEKKISKKNTIIIIFEIDDDANMIRCEHDTMRTWTLLEFIKQNKFGTRLLRTRMGCRLSCSRIIMDFCSGERSLIWSLYERRRKKSVKVDDTPFAGWIIFRWPDSQVFTKW